MKFNLSIFTKYLKKFSYGDRAKPFRDWLVIALVSLVLLFAAAGWSYFLFARISSGEIFGSPTVVTDDASSDTLQVVEATFQKRAVERTHYLTDYHFVDPSR
jgi:hypothetical protein